jgi:hypothetical protein
MYCNKITKINGRTCSGNDVGEEDVDLVEQTVTFSVN